MRTYVTLDPEFIPWEPQSQKKEPMRRLRRRRLIPAKYRGLASIVSALLLLGGVYVIFTYVIGGGLLQSNATNNSATAEAASAASQAASDAASAAAEPVSPLATPPATTPTPPPMAAMVTPGQLALVRADAEPHVLECAQYRVLRGNELLGFGSTEGAGVALAIPKRKVDVFCDGVHSEY